MRALSGLQHLRRLPGALALLALVAACGTTAAAPAVSPEVSGASAPAEPAEPAVESDEADLLPVPAGARKERGRASYYSDKLSGRATASGEPYDPRALTAAHRTLPFGTVVDVTGPEGKRVQVRINDRGPFRRGRIIDLSRAAAERLGMIKAGVVDVTMRIVHRPPPKARRKRRR